MDIIKKVVGVILLGIGTIGWYFNEYSPIYIVFIMTSIGFLPGKNKNMEDEDGKSNKEN